MPPTKLPHQQQPNRDDDLDPPILHAQTNLTDSSSLVESTDDDGTSTPPVLRMMRTQMGPESTQRLLRPLFPEPTPIGTPFILSRPSLSNSQKLINIKATLARLSTEFSSRPLDKDTEEYEGYGYYDGHEIPGFGWQAYEDTPLSESDLDDHEDHEDDHDDHHEDRRHKYPSFLVPAISDGVLYQPYDSLSDTDEEPVADPNNFQFHKYDKNYWFPEDRPYDPRYDINSDQWDCALYHELRDAAVADHLASR